MNPGSTRAASREASRPVAPAPSEPPTSEELEITSVFQPIVDLLTGTPIGYEVLSRSSAAATDAEDLFASARRRGTTWQLERACRRTAMRRISEIRRGRQSVLFFLNVSPDVLEDPRFLDDFTSDRLRRHGIDPSTIVLEVTEKESIADHERFASIVGHFTTQGLQFAVDDFGSGHSRSSRVLPASSSWTAPSCETSTSIRTGGTSCARSTPSPRASTRASWQRG